MACKGHGGGKGGHNGVQPRKSKKEAAKACSVKLAKKKADTKSMAAFIKKLRAKK